MDELDEEIFAVTSTRAKPTSKSEKEKNYSSDDGSERSESDAEESDVGYDSDDAMIDDGDDDKDDESEEDDDEDDDDFMVGGKKKSSRKPAARKGRTTKKKKSAPKKKKAAPPRRERAKLNLDDIDDDDEMEEEEFRYEFDEDGYGDTADRDRLMRMTEVQRETLLEERVANRKKEYDLWKVGRDMQRRARAESRESVETRSAARRSGRSKVNAKSVALNDMLDKERKPAKLADLSDADSEPDRQRMRTSSPGDAPSAVSAKAKPSSPEEKKPVEPERGPDLMYSDLVNDRGSTIRTTLLFIRRDVLLMLTKSPGFKRAVQGLFVRVRVAGKNNPYLLCRIVGVETGKVYTAQHNVRTDQYVVLQSGVQHRTFSIEWCSASHPTSHEFATYKQRLLDGGGSLPNREEIDELYKKAESFIVKKNAKITDEERKEHRAMHERVYPEQVNWTVKRTEVQMALDVKKQDYEVALRRGQSELAEKLSQEVEVCTERLRNVQAMERKYVRKDYSSNAKIFKELAAKNRAENMRNDRLANTQRLRSANAQGTAAAFNPYARFETTGKSYYSVGGKKNKTKEPKVEEKEEDNGWRSELKTWKQEEVKRKIKGVAIQDIYATPLAGLDDLVWPPPANIVEKMPKSLKRGNVDEIYSAGCKKKRKLPPSAKIISFLEWNKLRLQI